MVVDTPLSVETEARPVMGIQAAFRSHADALARSGRATAGGDGPYAGTSTHTVKRSRLAASALLASLLISPAAPVITPADPPLVAVASADSEHRSPTGFEIDVTRT